MHRPWVILIAALAALSFGSGAAAQAGSPVVVSGASPLAGCKVKGEEGTNYLNAEVEPWIDVSPANSSRMVGVWQQDRWSNGGARGLVSAYSADGGKKWKRVVVPGINKCSGGKGDFAYERSSAPWVAISPDGTSYILALSSNGETADGFGTNAVLVSRSTNGGASWGPPTVLRRDTDPRVLNDKVSLTADPVNARYAYVTWDRFFDSPASADSIVVDQPPQARTRGHASALTLPARPGAKAAEEGYFEGPVYFARTTNGGATWEPARLVYDPGRNAQSFGNQVVVLNDGTLLLFYMETFNTGENRIRFLRSSDHGASFSAPVDAAFTVGSDTGTQTPDTQEPVRDGSYLFDVAVDRVTGRLYLVWQDSRQDGITRTAFAMSSNGGASWSAPAIISRTPANANPLRTQAFVPSVEVGADSRVYVTYYDFRNDRTSRPATELADYWAIGCQPLFADCRQPAEWGFEARLTANSFDMLKAPQSGPAYFLGDYQGLVKQGTSVRALFTIATTRGQTSIVTSLVR